MSVSFSVKADVQQVMKALSKAQQQVVPAAVQQSLNRAIKETHTASIRETATTLKVKQKYARGKLRFQRRDRASRWNWEAGVFTLLGDFPASAFGKPRQLKKGAKAGRYRFPGAFVATMRKRVKDKWSEKKKKMVYDFSDTERGPVNVWEREGKKRLPIRMVRVPVRDTIERIVRSKIETVGMPAFRKRFDHEMTFRLRQAGL